MFVKHGCFVDIVVTYHDNLDACNKTLKLNDTLIHVNRIWSKRKYWTKTSTKKCEQLKKKWGSIRFSDNWTIITIKQSFNSITNTNRWNKLIVLSTPKIYSLNSNNNCFKYNHMNKFEWEMSSKSLFYLPQTLQCKAKFIGMIWRNETSQNTYCKELLRAQAGSMCIINIIRYKYIYCLLIMVCKRMECTAYICGDNIRLSKNMCIETIIINH